MSAPDGSAGACTPAVKRRGRRLPSHFRPGEAERLLAAAASPRDRVILLLGLYCGLRVAEICARRVEDLDLGRRLLTVRHGKGDKDRAVPLPAAVLPELAAWVAGRSSGWLFPSNRRAAGHLCTRTAQFMIVATAGRAGLDRRVHMHLLRHHYAQSLLVSGANVIDVQHLLGHASVATTQVYLHADPEHLRGAVDRLQLSETTPAPTDLFPPGDELPGLLQL